jgi:hypothetical protein
VLVGLHGLRSRVADCDPKASRLESLHETATDFADTEDAYDRHGRPLVHWRSGLRATVLSLVLAFPRDFITLPRFF